LREPPPEKAEIESPPCADEPALNARANANLPCTLVGTYSLKPFTGKGNTDLGEWPIVTLADGTDVMLESLWHEAKAPDAATVTKFRGQTVVVTGIVHSSPPREMPANFFHWTLSPVLAIALQ
jgi:hypothetical protein